MAGITAGAGSKFYEMDAAELKERIMEREEQYHRAMAYKDVNTAKVHERMLGLYKTRLMKLEEGAQ